MNNKRKARIDLTGRTFDRLTVLSFSHYSDGDHPHWACKCICGNETKVAEHGLLKGKIKSCGCYRIIDLTGNRYGRIVVQKKYEKRGSKYYWLVKCDCGNTAFKSGESIRRGNTQSCGCLLIESRKVDKGHDRTDVMISGLYKKIVKRHNKIDGDSTVITFQEYKELVFDKCHYCNSKGLSIIRDVRKEKKGKVFVTENVLEINGVDRMDNSKGYTISNSITCCKVCNVAKHIQGIDDFRAWVIKVYEHWVAQENRFKEAIAQPLFDNPDIYTQQTLF